MRLIGLTGMAGSGKDTVARFLVGDHGYRRFAFADRLKELVYRIDPPVWNPERAYMRKLSTVVQEFGWDVAKRNFPEVRQLLQETGMACRDLFGEDFWVDQVFNAIAHPVKDFVVITDVRFPNEAERVKAFGGTLAKVVRPDVEPVRDHISESGIHSLPIDIEIVNDGTVDDLRENVRLHFGVWLG